MNTDAFQAEELVLTCFSIAFPGSVFKRRWKTKSAISSLNGGGYELKPCLPKPEYSASTLQGSTQPHQQR